MLIGPSVVNGYEICSNDLIYTLINFHFKLQVKFITQPKILETRGGGPYIIRNLLYFKMDLSENDASHFIPEEPPPDGGHDEGEVAVEPLQRRGDGEVDSEQHPVGRTLQAKSRYSVNLYFKAKMGNNIERKVPLGIKGKNLL